MVENRKEINKVYKPISKKLWDEISYACDNLNAQEQNKTQGYKKHKHTLLEASHELGKHLNGLRKKKKNK